MHSTPVRPRQYKWDRLLGLIFIVGGAVFLVIGTTGSGTPIEDVSKAASQHQHETVLYVLGGLSAIVAGAIVAIVRPLR